MVLIQIQRDDKSGGRLSCLSVWADVPSNGKKALRRRLSALPEVQC